MIFIHFLPHDLPSELDETKFYGWHVRLAHALYRTKKIPSILVRLKSRPKPEYVAGISYIELDRRRGPSYGFLGINTCKVMSSILKRVEGEDVVIYIHEWKALNSLVLLRCIKDHDVVVVVQQHHIPPLLFKYLTKKWLSKWLYKSLFYLEYKLLSSSNVKVIYTLNKFERDFYSELFRDKIVKIGTMGTWFPTTETRKDFGEFVDVVYVGPLYVGSAKGGDVVLKYFLRRRDQRLRLFLIGPSEHNLCQYANSRGAFCLGPRPNFEVLNILKRAHLFVWVASREIYWGGIGVSVMEATAYNTPAASPTLIHHPGDIDRLGWIIPWREAGEDVIYRKLDLILESLKSEKKEPYREAIQYYDWNKVVERILNDINSVA